MRRAAASLAAVAFFVCAGAAAQQHSHRFSGAEKWARVFDDPARDAWQKPDEVVRELQLPPDAAVADIGAGTGYFAVRLARVVPQGRVYAVDAEPDMVRYLAHRAHHDGLANLVAVQAAPDDARIPAPVNVILIVDTYHHIDRRVDYFRRLHASLRSGGRLAIVDFRPEGPMGPPPAQRVAAATVTRELAEAGYALAASHDFLPNQYFLVFTR